MSFASVAHQHETNQTQKLLTKNNIYRYATCFSDTADQTDKHTHQPCDWLLLTEDPPVDLQYNYSHMMWRDERRFRAADTNGDMMADKQDFTAFLHPEDYEHMKDIVVQVSTFR